MTDGEGAMSYVTLSHIAPSSFLYFILVLENKVFLPYFSFFLVYNNVSLYTIYIFFMKLLLPGHALTRLI